MVEFLVELLCSWFFWFVAWIVVLPLWLLFATPYVLVTAAFDSSSYCRAVRARYRHIFESFVEFWTNIWTNIGW